MAEEQRKADSPQKGTNTTNDQYPLDSNCYEIVNEIGKGVSVIVYKAICTPMNSSIVAIKAIDLEKTNEDFDEAKTMTLLCHPNILKSHCSFTVGSSLWVVMPFMKGGSLKSIMASSFPDGLSEPCIATVLKEILSALSYLHGQGHCHQDIKAGNILIDSDGSVKLADFGVSASIYERNSGSNPSGSSSSSSLMLTDVAGTPYWMAPEVIHSHTGYGLEADIWSFGITALELAHGRPPLSHLPPSKSLVMKIKKRLRFYEKTKDSKDKKFSKSLKSMVGMCLDQDPSRRPSADKLLKHSFFKNCKGPEFLVKNVLQDLPTVEHRFSDQSLHESGDKEDDCSSGEIVKDRRISGWSFNKEGFELGPVFPSDEKVKEGDGDERGSKRVSFGGETIIPEKGSGSNSNTGKVENSQMQCVTELIETQFEEGTAEMNLDEHLIKMIEDLKMEIENGMNKICALEREVESLKLKSTQAYYSHNPAITINSAAETRNGTNNNQQPPPRDRYAPYLGRDIEARIEENGNRGGNNSGTGAGGNDDNKADVERELKIREYNKDINTYTGIYFGGMMVVFQAVYTEYSDAKCYNRFAPSVFTAGVGLVYLITILGILHPLIGLINKREKGKKWDLFILTIKFLSFLVFYKGMIWSTWYLPCSRRT